MIGALAVYSADVAYPAGQRHICCGRYPATWDSEKRVTEAAGRWPAITLTATTRRAFTPSHACARQREGVRHCRRDPQRRY
jgi:hypothetical protein